MEPVSAPAESRPRACYLPHHGVFRVSSSTTRLRVVFNGSQRTRSGKSLNNHLLVGKNLLPALADVLSRWRLHRYGFVTDIEKMTDKFSFIRKIATTNRCCGDTIPTKTCASTDYVS